MKIAVVGTGYVGLVTGACFSDMGHTVVCHDVDRPKIEALSRGEIPIFEPGLKELVDQGRRLERLSFTTSLAEAITGAEVAFIGVGTPAREDGSADVDQVLAVAKAIAAVASEGLLVVIKSTVPVGTCEQARQLIAQVIHERGATLQLDVVSNPEFLKEGFAVEDCLRPDRIVLGAERQDSIDRMFAVYRPFIRNGHPFLVMDVRSAELSKYASNAMLATRISFMNELAGICEHVGADIMNVRRGVGTDQRIGSSFLYAGIGYGGSCLPKDVRALTRLATSNGCHVELLDAVERINRRQQVTLGERIRERFDGVLKGRSVAVWGLAFKPRTDDIREAPALRIVRFLCEHGATVRAYDPEATERARQSLAEVAGVTFCKTQYEALEDVDALALITEWGVFRNPDFARMRSLMSAPIIFDGRNQYEPAEMQRLGFEYHCIGRGAR